MKRLFNLIKELLIQNKDPDNNESPINMAQSNPRSLTTQDSCHVNLT